MMDDYGYGSFAGGVAYPHGVSSSASASASNLSASAPPFMADRPPQNTPPLVEFRDLYGEPFNSHISPKLQRFPIGELGETTAYGSFHRLPTAWPYNPGYVSAQREVQQTLGFPVHHRLSPSPPPSSLLYADVTGLGTCGLRGEDSYNNMFASRDMFPSRGKQAAFAGVAHPNNKYSYEQCVDFVPTYDSLTSVSGSSTKLPESCYPQEPSFQPVEPGGNYVSSNAFHEKFPKQHCVSRDELATMKAVPHFPVEPEINVPKVVAPLPISSVERQALFDGSPIRSHLGGGEPLQNDRSVSNNVPENILAAESSFQSSCIDPVNFNMLLGSDEATDHIKPLFEGLDLHSMAVDLPCWKGPGVSRSPSFKPTSSSSLLKYKPDESSGSSLHFGPNFIPVNTDDDAIESSLKNPRENLQPEENRLWGQFMTSASEGPSAPDLLSEESESYDAMKVESRNAQSVVSQADYVNQPSSKDVQANLGPCTNLEQTLPGDLSSSEEKSQSGGLALEDRRSNVIDVSNFDLSHGRVSALGDSSSPRSSLKVHSVFKAMHSLSELLVYEYSDNGTMLMEQDLETLKEVVNNLNKCLKTTTRGKAKTEEASLPEQVVSESSSEMVKLHGVTKIATTDVQGPPFYQHVKAVENQCDGYGYTEKVKNDDKTAIWHLPVQVTKVAATDFQGPTLDQHIKAAENQCDGYGYTERVKNDEMTKSIKNILASNFPNDKERQPQVLLFKNLWLEAEAALCSTTYMTRFYRVRNEIENYKSHDTKETSTNAESPSMQVPSPYPYVPAMNGGEEKRTDGFVHELPIVDATSHGNNVMRSENNVLRSWGFNSDSVDALIGNFSGGLSVSPDQSMDGKFNPDAMSGKIPSADSHIAGTCGYVNDVTDRFQILKCREAEHKPLNNLDSDKVGQQTAEDKKSSQTSETQSRDSPVITASINPDNLEASVMARFHILKSRTDHCSASETSMGAQLDAAIPTVEEEVSNVEDAKEKRAVCARRSGIHESELSGRDYESPPSEWEHVLRDELPDQTR